jgi:hypothetical protein
MIIQDYEHVYQVIFNLYVILGVSNIISYIQQ